MKGSTVLKFFLGLIVAVFVINQLVAMFYNPVKTESAVYYTSTEGFNITGIIVRNETLVKSNSNGVMHFVTGDGSRVAKNGVIANIYDDENASIAVTQTKLLEGKIADIEDILSYNDIEAANLDLINEKIKNKLNALIYSVSAGNYGNLASFSEDLLSVINRKQAALGVTESLVSELAALKAQLNVKLPTPKGSVRAGQSGYFVSKTDGYEQVLNVEDLSTITPEFLNGASAAKYDNTVIGKIVSDYEWYIAAEVSLNESLNFKEGETLKVLTAVNSAPELSVKVQKINISETQARAVIVFVCDQMNSELAAMRSGPMTVVKAQYQGLKVSRSALRVVESIRGVYVLNGMQVNFVPVNILYSNDSYIICEKINENGNVLKLYDRVVVKGKNLYDGKIVG